MDSAVLAEGQVGRVASRAGVLAMEMAAGKVMDDEVEASTEMAMQLPVASLETAIRWATVTQEAAIPTECMHCDLGCFAAQVSLL